VHFSNDLNGSMPDLPDQVHLTQHGENWLRYQTDQPQLVNPRLLSQLLANGFPVVSLQEVSRSLEQVYMQAISAPETGEATTYDG
jgi:hypothetical protein